MIGVSFVIPVRNAEPWLAEVLDAVLAQDDGRPFEVIVIEDGSTDGSAQILERYQPRVQVLRGSGRGAAAALNLGAAHARHPILCQVDQDVIVRPGWMARLAAELDSPEVGAAQGWYETDPRSSLWARVMGFEFEHRHTRVRGRFVDQVCSGNTVYRAAALASIGGFDERLGYGYDNDVSYRLGDAGFKLVLCREARSVHRWRERARDYLRQQYGFGFGRLDVVAKHLKRVSGDMMAPLSMMLHAPLMLLLVLLAAATLGLRLAGHSFRAPAACALVLAWLVGERLWASLAAWRRFRNPATLFFVPAHLLRDLAWAAAIAVWSARHLFGQRSVPSHSMKARSAKAGGISARGGGGTAAPPRQPAASSTPSLSHRR